MLQSPYGYPNILPALQGKKFICLSETHNSQLLAVGAEALIRHGRFDVSVHGNPLFTSQWGHKEDFFGEDKNGGEARHRS